MFHNNPSNFYAFLPMLLAGDKRYQELSARGLILYALMLSRMNLSERNKDKFSDDEGVFIYFSTDEICSLLNCSKPTAIKTVQELISAELVKKGECPIGKSPRYYVKKMEKQLPINKKQNEEKKSDPEIEETEKKPSFDIERAQKAAEAGLYDFGSMKTKKRRTRNTGPTI